MSGTESKTQSKTQKFTLITLGVVAVVTVFFLPQFVTEPWWSNTTEEQLQELPPPAPDEVAPSTAAELTRYRQDSQSVLAEIVIVRDRLLERNVETWAQADFHSAVGKVETGDEEYSYGNYEKSLRLYREARDQLTDLTRMGDEKLFLAKADGFAAVESLNLNIAQQASELALAIDEDDPEVQELKMRVETLPQVIVHVEAADHAFERDRFEEARSEYKLARDLDPDLSRANEGFSMAQAEITGGAFRTRMSRGFSALENGDYEGARAAFRSAAEIEPRNPAVGQALAQVDNRENLSSVNQELARALDLESAENWAGAVAIYESLLAEDSTLAAARARLLPARVRAELDEKLVTYIEDPLLLSSRSGYEAAQSAFRDAQGISNGGPKLQGQVDQLDVLLKRATSPVDVVFRSDNQTHVVLYRVAELGTFERTSMRLRPGRYVAAGTRDGFRDVRVEFTITGEPMDEAIVVRCEEPIG
ncbi:MAG TPA: hypothetical protein VJ984_09060 [Xanthomonadales bacterium]|nr:hypothetical protein [Xanthomonadales bacterium]